MARQVYIAPEHAAAGAVNEIDRRTRSLRMNFHERLAGRAVVFLGLLTQNRRQLPDGLRLENRRQPQFALKRFLDLRGQSHRQQGMSAQVKEPVLNPDWLDAQNLFPDFRELQFD